MALGTLGLLVIQIGLNLLSRLLAPRQKRRDPSPFEAPTIEEGGIIPWGFGIFQVAGTITLVRDVTIREKESSGEVWYLAKMQSGLVWGPVDVVYDIIADERSVALQKPSKKQSEHGQTPATISPSLPYNFADGQITPAQLTVAVRQMFGGDSEEGGLEGEIRLYRGADNQEIDPLIDEHYGDLASAYPWLCYAMLGQKFGVATGSAQDDLFMLVANNPTPKPMSFILGTYPRQLLASDAAEGTAVQDDLSYASEIAAEANGWEITNTTGDVVPTYDSGQAVGGYPTSIRLHLGAGSTDGRWLMTKTFGLVPNAAYKTRLKVKANGPWFEGLTLRCRSGSNVQEVGASGTSGESEIFATVTTDATGQLKVEIEKTGGFPFLHNDDYWFAGLIIEGLVADDGRIGQDANPAEVLYEIFTNKVWGKAEPASTFDLPQWQQKAREFKDEGLGVSGLIAGRTIDDVKDDILSHIDGEIVTDPLTGLIQLKTARADYDINSITQLTDENTKTFRQGEAQFAETLNEVKVKYQRFDGGTPGRVDDMIVFGRALTETLVNRLVFGVGGWHSPGRNISNVSATLTRGGNTYDLVLNPNWSIKDADFTYRSEDGYFYFAKSTQNHGAWQEGDVIRVSFTSAPTFSGFVDSVATSQNPTNRQLVGRVRSESYDYPMYTTQTAAQRKADLLRLTTSRRLDVFQWTMGREGSHLTPMDVVLANAPKYRVVGVPIRITRVVQGTLENPDITFEGVEDVFGERLQSLIPAPSEGAYYVQPGAYTPTAPPIAAFYCAGEDTIGILASDPTFRIEIWRADDAAGTNEELVEDIDGNTETWVDTTPGKAHKARLIRDGYNPGPFTDWLIACPAGGEVACVLPVYTDSATVSDPTGTLDVTYVDEQGRHSRLEFKTIDPNGVSSDWEAAAEPYSQSVEVEAGKVSYISRRAYYYNCDGDEVYSETTSAFSLPSDDPGTPGGEDPGSSTTPFMVEDVDLYAGGNDKEWLGLNNSGLDDLFLRSAKPINAAPYTRALIKGTITETPADGTILAVQYTTDLAGVLSGTAAWQFLDHASGPYIEVSTSGAFRSLPVVLNPAARTVIVLRAVATNGDGVTALVIGGLAVEFDNGIPGTGVGDPPLAPIDADPDPESPATLPIAPAVIAWYLGDRGKDLSVGGAPGTVYSLDTETIDDINDLLGLGFDLVVTGDVPGAATVDTVIFESGARSIRFDMNKPAWYSGLYYYRGIISGLAPGATYTATVRCRVMNKPWFMTPIFRIGNGSSGALTAPEGSWGTVTSTGAADSNGDLKLEIGIPGDTIAAINWSCWFDDVIEIEGETVGGVMIRLRDQGPFGLHMPVDAPVPLPDYLGDTNFVDLTEARKLKLHAELLRELSLQGGEVFLVAKAAADPGGTDRELWDFGSSGTPSEYPSAAGHILEDIGSETRHDLGDPTPDLTDLNLYHVRFTRQDWVARLQGETLLEVASNVLAFAQEGTVGGGIALREMVFTVPLTLEQRFRFQDELNRRYTLGFPFTVNEPNQSGEGGTPGTNNDDSTDDQTNVGGSNTGSEGNGAGDPPTPRPQGGRYFLGYGAQPSFGSNPFRGALGSFGWWMVDELADAEAANCQMMFGQGGYSKFKNPDGSFSYAKYEAWLAPQAYLEPLIKPYWTSGTLIGVQCIDDIDPSNWTGGISGPMIDKLAALWKKYFPWIMVDVRAKPSQLGDGPFRFLDSCCAQYWARHGDVVKFRDNELRRAQQLKLRIRWGLNITDGGSAKGPRSPMTADQIRTWGGFLARTTYSDGMTFWRYPPTGGLAADIITALVDVRDILDATPSYGA